MLSPCFQNVSVIIKNMIISQLRQLILKKSCPSYIYLAKNFIPNITPRKNYTTAGILTKYKLSLNISMTLVFLN